MSVIVASLEKLLDFLSILFLPVKDTDNLYIFELRLRAQKLLKFFNRLEAFDFELGNEL